MPKKTLDQQEDTLKTTYQRKIMENQYPKIGPIDCPAVPVAFNASRRFCEASFNKDNKVSPGDGHPLGFTLASQMSNSKMTW